MFKVQHREEDTVYRTSKHGDVVPRLLYEVLEEEEASFLELEIVATDGEEVLEVLQPKHLLLETELPFSMIRRHTECTPSIV